MSSNSVIVEIPEKLRGVFQGNARYRGAYGGRGSGKTRTFAKMLILRAIDFAFNKKVNGTIMCSRETMKSLKDSSMSEVKHAIKELGFSHLFHYGEHYIRSSNGIVDFTFDGLRQNVDNIKSKSRILICWIDEAESISENSWQTLIPTIREDLSEIWVTWNPKFENSATDLRFKKVFESLNKSLSLLRDDLDGSGLTEREREDINHQIMSIEGQLRSYKFVEINWRDNPWFPKSLDKERLIDLKRDQGLYNHIWEGGYITFNRGSYYADMLARAREEGRVTHVPKDPYYRTYAFWDLGGTGVRSDATSIWVAQFIDKEIRLIDYYESQGQSLGYHVEWLRSNGYDNSLMVLPHDGNTNDRVYNVSFQSELINAGFSVEVVKNQGTGAAIKRIEASRKWFDRMVFDDGKTSAGIKALEWYHEKRDEHRNIGLGVMHDWSSHAADAFGLLSVYYQDPSLVRSNMYYSPQRSETWAGI